MKNFNKICGIDEEPLTFEEIKNNANLSDKQLLSTYHTTEADYKEFIKQEIVNQQKQNNAEAIKSFLIVILLGLTIGRYLI